MISDDILRLLDDVAVTGVRAEKERLLEHALSHNLFRRVAAYAYDPFITFGITPPKVETKGKVSFNDDSEWLWSIVKGLANRSISGGEANRLVLNTMTTLNQPSADLLWRILSKDLRCGITAKTLNKVEPGFISTFEVMLSQHYEARRIQEFPVAVEPKMDGLRAMCVLQGGVGAFYSRVGNEFPALQHLVASMAWMLESAITHLQNPIEGMSEEDRHVFWSYLGGSVSGASAGIDGEAITGLFNESGAIKRKNESVDAEIHLFDVVPRASLLDPNVKAIANEYQERRRILEFLIRHKPEGAPIYLMRRYFANSHAEIDRLYERLRATTLANYLARGNAEREKELEAVLVDKATGRPKVLEGAMVKTLDGPYVKKKGSIWQKIKPEETEELYIAGAYEGEGKYAGKLGGVIVWRPFESKLVEVRIGGGISDDERAEWWEMYLRDNDRLNLADLPGPLPSDFVRLGCELLGRLIEVEFNEVTPDGSLRHPRFVRFRDDKDEARRAA